MLFRAVIKPAALLLYVRCRRRRRNEVHSTAQYSTIPRFLSMHSLPMGLYITMLQDAINTPIKMYNITYTPLSLRKIMPAHLAEHIVAKGDIGVSPVNIARHSSLRLEQQSRKNLVRVFEQGR